MNERIELHIESSYSYKNLGSVITPNELLEKVKREGIDTICIIDYCSCSIIPKIESLKENMELDNLKVIYGISLNIKYGELYVPTVVIAKNSQGIKNLYKIVTKLNQDQCYFILNKDLEPYKDDLILGISKFDLDKDYKNVLDYYTYVEVTPERSKEDVIKINEYCIKNNLLLVATSRPTRLDKDDMEKTNIVKNLYQTYATISDTSYYYSTKEMLNAFDYLDNKEEVVIDNSKKIASMVDNYTFEFKNTFMIQAPNYDLSAECYERANLIYIEDIPENVKERLDYELEIIEKNDLVGTVSLLESIIHHVKKLGGYAMVGSYFSHSLVAYLLGLTPINPMNLDEQMDFLNNYERYGFHFEIFIPEKIQEELKKFLGSILKGNKLYNRSSFYGIGDSSTFANYINKIDTVEHKEYIKLEMKKIKTKIECPPYLYFIVPKDIDILDITPTNIYARNYCDLEILDFSYNLFKTFVTLRFHSTDTFNLIHELSHKTKIFVEDIPLDDKKVLNDSYIIVERNNFEEYKTYFLQPKIKLYLDEGGTKIESLYDLIHQEEFVDSNFISKIICYYYISYYRTYHEKEYYEIYFDYLARYYGYDKIYDTEFLEKFETSYKNNKVLDEINDEKDGCLKLIKETMYTMYEKNLDFVIKILTKNYKENKKNE